MKKKKIIKVKKKENVGNYAVKIEYHYLIKANNQQEAIGIAMDRLLGRNFKNAYFNGMVTHCELTDEIPPTLDHIKGAESHSSLEEMENFQVRPVMKDERSTAYGVKLNGNRKDTKKQDHIHFNSADAI